MASRSYLNLYRDRLRSLNNQNREYEDDEDDEQKSSNFDYMESSSSSSKESSDENEDSKSDEPASIDTSRSLNSLDKELGGAKEDSEIDEIGYMVGQDKLDNLDVINETDEAEEVNEYYNDTKVTEINKEYAPLFKKSAHINAVDAVGDITDNDILAAAIHNGDYDDELLSAFRCNYFDLRQLTSGVSFNHVNSIFHRVAEFCGLPSDDDAIAFMIYRVYMYNRRGIRDRLIGCECCRGKHHFIANLASIKDKHLAFDRPKYIIKKVHIQLPRQINKRPPAMTTRPSLTIPSKPPPPTGDAKPPKSEPKPEPKAKPKPPTPSPEKSPTPEQVSSEEQSEEPEPSIEVPKVLTESSLMSTPSSAFPPLPTPEFSYDISSEQEKKAKKGQAIAARCPRCNYEGITQVQYKMGFMTFITACGFLAVCLLPCACLPFVSNCTKDMMHICPECRFILGTVRRKPCGNKLEWNWEKGQAKLPSRFKNSKVAKRMSMMTGNINAENLTSRLSMKVANPINSPDEHSGSNEKSGSGSGSDSSSLIPSDRGDKPTGMRMSIVGRT